MPPTSSTRPARAERIRPRAPATWQNGVPRARARECGSHGARQSPHADRRADRPRPPGGPGEDRPRGTHRSAGGTPGLRQGVPAPDRRGRTQGAGGGPALRDGLLSLRVRRLPRRRRGDRARVRPDDGRVRLRRGRHDRRDQHRRLSVPGRLRPRGAVGARVARPSSVAPGDRDRARPRGTSADRHVREGSSASRIGDAFRAGPSARRRRACGPAGACLHDPARRAPGRAGFRADAGAGAAHDGRRPRVHPALLGRGDRRDRRFPRLALARELRTARVSGIRRLRHAAGPSDPGRARLRPRDPHRRVALLARGRDAAVVAAARCGRPDRGRRPVVREQDERVLHRPPPGPDGLHRRAPDRRGGQRRGRGAPDRPVHQPRLHGARRADPAPAPQARPDHGRRGPDTRTPTTTRRSSRCSSRSRRTSCSRRRARSSARS